MALTVSAHNQFSEISEINSDKATWNIKAKIVRLWQVSDFNRNTLPFSIEMVLMDKDGGRIHATIKKTLIYKFKDDLIEGKVYCLENLGVSTNGGAYRTTHHPYKMNFQYSSFVQRLSNFEINRSPFDFVPISDIVSGVYDTDFLCDVMGVLTGFGQEREITNQNGTTTKLNVIILEQNGHKIQCTLFGPYVDELNAFLGAGDCNNAIVIMQLAKAKSFQDKIHIQNCLNCSVLIFNSTCAESVALRSSLAESVESPSPLTLTQINLDNRVEPIDDFLHNTPRITLQSLRDAPTGSFHVVSATVKRILNPDSFYYTACQCGKAVIPDSRMFYCEKCNKHVSRVVPRFCIKVRVMDDTDSAILVLFDNIATTLFDISCADMIHEFQNAVGVGGMPTQLQGLIDNTWLFKVEAKAFQNQRFEQSFRVKKICTDAAIIRQFQLKWDKEEADFSKATNEIGSLSTIVGKGKDILLGGSPNVLSEDFNHSTGSSFKGKEVSENSGESSIKGKEIVCLGTPIDVSQDLMNKFSLAAVNLGDNSDVVFENTPTPVQPLAVQEKKQTVVGKEVVSVENDDEFVKETPNQVASKEDACVKEAVPTNIINLEDSDNGRSTVHRRKAVLKRVSPSNAKEDEDDNAPIKLLKRAIKIEKIA